MNKVHSEMNHIYVPFHNSSNESKKECISRDKANYLHPTFTGRVCTTTFGSSCIYIGHETSCLFCRKNTAFFLEIQILQVAAQLNFLFVTLQIHLSSEWRWVKTFLHQNTQQNMLEIRTSHKMKCSKDNNHLSPSGFILLMFFRK